MVARFEATSEQRRMVRATVSQLDIARVIGISGRQDGHVLPINTAILLAGMGRIATEVLFEPLKGRAVIVPDGRAEMKLSPGSVSAVVARRPR